MIIVVAKEGKIYYVKEMTGQGIAIKKSKDSKYMLCLDDKVEPIAIYKNWENANNILDTITRAWGSNEKFAVIPPND